MIRTLRHHRATQQHTAQCLYVHQSESNRIHQSASTPTKSTGRFSVHHIEQTLATRDMAITACSIGWVAPSVYSHVMLTAAARQPTPVTRAPSWYGPSAHATSPEQSTQWVLRDPAQLALNATTTAQPYPQHNCGYHIQNILLYYIHYIDIPRDSAPTAISQCLGHRWTF